MVFEVLADGDKVFAVDFFFIHPDAIRNVSDQQSIFCGFFGFEKVLGRELNLRLEAGVVGRFLGDF